METSAEAEKDGDGYRLSGTKTWITNAPIADVALVWARRLRTDGRTSPSGRDDAGDGPVRGFLVETDADAVETPEIDGKLSMRASSTGQVVLNDVRVSEDAVLPGVEGMKGPLSCLTQARYGIAWGAVGAARDCFEVAREYATDREAVRRPHRPLPAPAGETRRDGHPDHDRATAGRPAGRTEGTRRATPQQVSMAKRNNVRTARDVARTAREMLGANGITTDYSPMRHAANMETVYTYEGTHDIHTPDPGRGPDWPVCVRVRGTTTVLISSRLNYWRRYQQQRKSPSRSDRGPLLRSSASPPVLGGPAFPERSAFQSTHFGWIVRRNGWE